MALNLLLTLFVPATMALLAYQLGKKSAKFAAYLVATGTIIDIILLLFLAPAIVGSGSYSESYYWLPLLGENLVFYVDGIGLSMAIVTLVVAFASTIYSIAYMDGRQNLNIYYSLLSLLIVGLVGVFITSNLLLFYFCWEFMLIPGYFIIGEWGYRNSYSVAFKFFIFTHAGAVFVLLGIGSVFMFTGSLDILSMGSALASIPPEILALILISFTFGFSVKMAVVPLHMWLPDAHSEAPAPMSALLSGVIIEAGAYAIFRISLQTIFPPILGTSFGDQFLLFLSLVGVVTAFFGAFIALVATDIKRIVAYSSISHMGYVMFGLSLFPLSNGVIGAIFHLVTHAVSKSLLFLAAGVIMHQTNERNLEMLGGLTQQMPSTALATGIASLSIAGVPAFACFISEFLIFISGFQRGLTSFVFNITSSLMIVVTVFSLAYSLRFFTKIFLGSPKQKDAKEASSYLKYPMFLLAVLTIILGIWPTPIIALISAAT
ncbi:MAG: complex I subunit 4 family protein [Candidatus Ranarchaeia archaeon]